MTPDPDPDRPGPEAMRAWRAFLEAHARVVDALERELRQEEDLPLAFYDVLVQLNEAPERRRRMQELAEAVLLSKSGVTRLVDRMEAAGLVAREPCADDRRVTWAVLTDAGFERLRVASRSHLRSVVRHFVDHVEPADLPALERALSAIAGADPPPTAA